MEEQKVRVNEVEVNEVEVKEVEVNIKEKEGQFFVAFDWDETITKLLANAIKILGPFVKNMSNQNISKELEKLLTYENRNIWKGFLLKIKNSKDINKDRQKIFQKLPEKLQKKNSCFEGSYENKDFKDFVDGLKIELNEFEIDKTPQIKGAIKLLNDLYDHKEIAVGIITNNATNRFLNSVFLQLFDKAKAKKLSTLKERNISEFNKELETELGKLTELTEDQKEWKEFIEKYILKCSLKHQESKEEKTRTSVLLKDKSVAIITKNSRRNNCEKPNKKMGDELMHCFSIKEKCDKVIYIGDKYKVDMKFAENCGFLGIQFIAAFGTYYDLKRISTANNKGKKDVENIFNVSVEDFGKLGESYQIPREQKEAYTKVSEMFKKDGEEEKVYEKKEVKRDKVTKGAKETKDNKKTYDINDDVFMGYGSHFGVSSHKMLRYVLAQQKVFRDIRNFSKDKLRKTKETKERSVF